MTTLHERIGNLLVERNETLTLFETTTGGLLAAQFVQLPGASKFLKGSVVGYANDFKEKALNLPDLNAFIPANGVVSGTFSFIMAGMTKLRYDSNWVIAEIGMAPYVGERKSSKRPGHTYYCVFGPSGKKTEDCIFLYENYDEINRWRWMKGVVLDILKNTIQIMEEVNAPLDANTDR